MGWEIRGFVLCTEVIAVMHILLSSSLTMSCKSNWERRKRKGRRAAQLKKGEEEEEGRAFSPSHHQRFKFRFICPTPPPHLSLSHTTNDPLWKENTTPTDSKKKTKTKQHFSFLLLSLLPTLIALPCSPLTFPFCFSSSFLSRPN